jgi:hypothetical protein
MENESVRVAEYAHEVGRKLTEYLHVLDALALPSNAGNIHRGYGERPKLSDAAREGPRLRPERDGAVSLHRAFLGDLFLSKGVLDSRRWFAFVFRFQFPPFGAIFGCPVIELHIPKDRVEQTTALLVCSRSVGNKIIQ